MVPGLHHPSPSRWSARLPVAALAVVGFAIAAYLTACQVGWVSAPWDPLFGAASSQRVLHSALARALPVPDAAVGAAGYLAELAADLAGGRERWRTHPLLVLAFGCIAAGLALAGISLVVVQAAVVRSFCTACLASALASVAAAAVVAVEGEVHAALGVALAGWRRRRVHAS